MLGKSAPSECDWRRGLLVALGIGVLFTIIGWGIYESERLSPPLIDYLEYWSAASLFLEGRDPYSIVEMQRVQEPFVGKGNFPILLWNPPLIFPFIVWLGALPYALGRVLWLLVQIVALMSGIAILSRLAVRYGGRELLQCTIREKSLLWGAIFTFYPLLLTLYEGQIPTLCFLGLAWYLYARFSQQHLFLSGIGLSLTLVKPHNLYLLYAVIVVEAVRTWRWRVVLGMLFGGVILSAISWCIQPKILLWYLDALREAPLYWQTPTLGSFLQGAFSSYNILSPGLLRLLPSLVVLLVVVLFVMRSPRKELSLEQVLVLIPCSLFTSLYGWIFDHLLLLPSCILLLLLQDRAPLYKRSIHWLLASHMAMLFIPFGQGQQNYWWFPLWYFVVLLLWYRALQSHACGSTSKRGSV